MEEDDSYLDAGAVATPRTCTMHVYTHRGDSDGGVRHDTELVKHAGSLLEHAGAFLLALPLLDSAAVVEEPREHGVRVILAEVG